MSARPPISAMIAARKAGRTTGFVPDTVQTTDGERLIKIPLHAGWRRRLRPSCPANACQGRLKTGPLTPGWVDQYSVGAHKR
jgi:hypothetical protein